MRIEIENFTCETPVLSVRFGLPLTTCRVSIQRATDTALTHQVRLEGCGFEDVVGRERREVEVRLTDAAEKAVLMLDLGSSPCQRQHLSRHALVAIARM